MHWNVALDVLPESATSGPLVLMAVAGPSCLVYCMHIFHGTIMCHALLSYSKM